MAKTRITPLAENDLEGIWSFIATDNVGAADQTVATVLDTAERIADMPGMGARRDDIRRGLRTFPVGKYLIFYRLIDTGIEVMRVVHGQRNLPEIFKSGRP